MTDTSPPFSTKRKTGGRKQGRPTSAEDGVGRSAIISAACDLIRTMSPDKVTRAEVARHANVVPRLIHYYFKDRPSLLRATASALSDIFQQKAGAAVCEDDPPDVQLKARIQTFLRFQLEYPYFHRLVIEEIVGGEGSSQSLLQTMSRRGVAGYERIIAKGEEDGTMRPVDASLLYLAIIGIVELAASGRPILRELGHSLPDDAEYIEHYSQFITDLLFNGLRAPQA
jgi:TetR/AcrR family transcriptional regulator